jgi:hypothetical protein
MIITFFVFSFRAIVGLERKELKAGIFFNTSETAASSPSTF